MRLVLTAAVLTTAATACQPPPPAEVEAAKHDRTLICIRHHESDRDPRHAPLYLGDATTPMHKNPTSSATGHYQWVKGSWPGAARSTGFGGWANTPVRFVPADVQHVVTYRYVHQSGVSPWRGSGCRDPRR